MVFVLSFASVLPSESTSIMKGHPPTWIERFSNKPSWVLGFIVLLFIGFHMFRKATTSSDIVLQTNLQSDVKALPEKQKTAINSCNWRPEPLAGQCDVTKPTDESKVTIIIVERIFLIKTSEGTFFVSNLIVFVLLVFFTFFLNLFHKSCYRFLTLTY